MQHKRLVTIISIVITIIIIAIATVLIAYKNNLTTNAVATSDNMSKNEQLPTETPTDEPSNEASDEPSPLPSANPKPIVPVGKYYIKVNTQANTVTIYVKDEKGNYTIPVKAMVCSTGYATPKNSKYQTEARWTWGLMFGGVYTQWETLITGNILFHSVPYLRRYDYNSLEYWEYNKLGTTCSAGCVRLTCADAKWIYDNCAIGTTVEFYASSNPGPLGKPTAPKIPTDSPYKGWDPTDSHSNNPWRNVIVETPLPEPTLEPTIDPSPVVLPSIEPSAEPTLIILSSIEPTFLPTQNPTETPSAVPSTDNNLDNVLPSIAPTSDITDLPAEEKSIDNSKE